MMTGDANYERTKEGGYRYVLTSPLSFHIRPLEYDVEIISGLWPVAWIDKTGWGEISEGYLSDGVTFIPGFRRILETPRRMPEVFVHDLLCQMQFSALFREYVADRAYADRRMFEGLRARGDWFAGGIHAAVRIGAALSKPRFHKGVAVTLYKPTQ